MKHSTRSEYELRLRSMLVEAAVELDDEQLHACLDHVLWMLDTNRSVNLTAITEVETALRLHVVDSLIALREVQGSPAGIMCDIGTGGGFPGVPLGLASARETLLVDSVGKKTRVLQEYLDSQGLAPRMRAVSTRAEDLALESPGAFAVVTMRAVSALPSLVELAAPLLMKGGRLIALKGDVSEEEVGAGKAAAATCGLTMVDVRRIVLPEGHESRSIVSYVVTSAPRIRLPRRNGLAQSKPLA